jgi:sec-independent protein translocase protein TatC
MALVPFPTGGVPARRDPDDDPYEDEDLDGAGGKMSFLEHLDELRNRLIYSVYALIGGCVISFMFVGRIQDFIMKPLYELMGSGEKLAYFSPGEGFMIMMKIGGLAGLFLALPVIVYQLWLFIAPGLYSREKRFVVPFVTLGTFFFIAGAAFSHYIAFPYTWKFFAGFETSYMHFVPNASQALSMWMLMLLAFAVVFQMPTIVFFLARMGMVSASFLMRHFKYAILIIFILGAVLSPGTDVMSQLIMAGPMTLLYILSIGIAAVFGKRKPKEE